MRPAVCCHAAVRLSIAPLTATSRCTYVKANLGVEADQAFRSARRIRRLGATSSEAAIAASFVRVGDKSPRSTWETYVGCTPLMCASCSCVSPALVLAAQSSRPKARVSASLGARIRPRMLADPWVVHRESS